MSARIIYFAQACCFALLVFIAAFVWGLTP